MKALPKKVLVVDDDPVIGRSIDRVLSEKGYEVSTALDGPEALKKFAREDYDVVFTDIRMPGMDGLEVAERMREKRPWTPVVIITGYGNAASVARAEAMGVAEFLHKPLLPETIERSARNALRVIEGGKGKVVAEKELPTPPPAVEASAGPAPVAAEAPRRGLKSIALFLAAPFIGLAYVIAFPFIGLGALAWTGLRALARRSGNVAGFVKDVALFLAAPFIGLAYAMAFPFIGLALLIRLGAQAWAKRSRRGE